ncbi:MAG: hypothetical protein Q9213_002522 [Squamulea squamosa]
MNSRPAILSKPQNKLMDQGSSILLQTPEYKSKNDRGPTREISKTSMNCSVHTTTSDLQCATRRQVPTPTLNRQKIRCKPSTRVLHQQENGPFVKKTEIPQPGILLLGKPKPSANSKRTLSSTSAPRSASTGSDGASLTSKKAYISSEVPATKSEVGIKNRGRSSGVANIKILRTQQSGPPSRESISDGQPKDSGKSQNQQSRVPTRDLINNGHPKGSGISQRNLSQRPVKSAALELVPREKNSETTEGRPDDHNLVQRELLKLHILHSTSANTHLQWRTSAKSHFEQRFKVLKERHVEIADISYQTQELKNRSALVDWCRNAQASEIGKRVYVLSSCIDCVYDDSGLGGDYSHTVELFRAWYDGAQRIHESRKHDPTHDTSRLGYVEEIGAGWQKDVNDLQRRLSALTGELRTLGSASASSNLGRILVLLQDLVMDMLTELDCMRFIEGELLVQEKLWLEEQITTLNLKIRNDMGGAKTTPRRGHALG